MTRDVPVVLTGYGPVGRAYAALLTDRADHLGRRYGVHLRLAHVYPRRSRCCETPHQDLRGQTAGEQGGYVGPEKALVFDCGQAGEITVSGGRSSPYAAALAMLKDTLDVGRDPHPGF